MPTFTVAELADRVGARVEGDASRRVSGVAPLADAGPDQLAFYARESLRGELVRTSAGALLVPEDEATHPPDAALLRVDDPELAMARLLPLFHPPHEPSPGVHPTAVLGRGVDLGEDVSIGPHAVLEEGTSVGAGSALGPSCFVGRGARLGRGCRLGPSVSIQHGVELGDRVIVHEGSRVGTDGFGYAASPDGARKIPQVGGCLIGDDVEIGANCTIDRGALGETEIGARTKIDNLVHIGHNVRVGPDCMVVAQVGIAGSVTVGQGAVLAGQVGIAGHLTIGAGARIAAQSGVIGDVPEGATYGGYPARPHREWLRASAAALRLPALLRRLHALEPRSGEGKETP